jgi:hypothetical protein
VRHTRRLFLALFFLTGPAAFADSDKKAGPENEAQRAAVQWLALVDEGRYGASWDEASSFFKNAISRSDWEKALQGVRAPLGGLKSRKVKSSTFTRTMPGAPDGEYVVVQYETEFERKASAVETITPERDKSGTWRVSGYYIK